MQIKNNTVCNQSVIGPNGYVTVVGESTLELDDNFWRANKELFADQLKAGVLELVTDVELTEEEEAELEDAEVRAAEKLLSDKKAKADAKKAKADSKK